MLLRLFLLFTLVPLVEVVLLVQLARWNGWVTLGIVLTTGLVGAALARRQGLRAWRRIQDELAAGRPPTGSLVDGVVILIAGTLLVTPGLLTDLTGFALLVPPVRRWLQRIVLAWLTRRATVRFQTFTSGFGPQARRDADPPGGTVIDAEFTREPPGDVEDDRRLP